MEQRGLVANSADIEYEKNGEAQETTLLLCLAHGGHPKNVSCRLLGV